MHKELMTFFDQMAPVWDQRELRDQAWLTNFITTYLPIDIGMNVLDLGCGTGIISEIIYQFTKTKVDAVDVSSKMIEIAKTKHNPKHIEFFHENFYQTKRTNYDMIVCFNAYPHFTDLIEFKKKSLDVLNHSGYLVIMHSLSRKQLSNCHKGLSSNISRELEPIAEEMKRYHDAFDVIQAIDNQEFFLMILQKK